MGFITRLAVKRQLKKHGFTGERGSIPLKDIRNAVVLFDVEDVESDECRHIAEEFFAAHGIVCKPFFLDLGKHGKDDIIVTGIKTTILRRNLAFRGTLPKDIVEELEASEAELFICLADNCVPAVRCFSGIVRAKFCIGRCDYAGSPFLMTFATPSGEDMQVNFHDSAKCIRSMTEYLTKIV